jgi:hypothetical protein
VVTLHRERFGDLMLEALSPGQWRELPLGVWLASPGTERGRIAAGDRPA